MFVICWTDGPTNTWEVDIDDNDKWGPAFAFPVCESENDPAIIGFVFYGYASS